MIKWLPQAISCSIEKSLPSFVILSTNPYPVISINNHWLIHIKTLWPISCFFLLKCYQLLIHFWNKTSYVINCFPASYPTNTSVTFICGPSPSPIGFYNWNYHLYWWKRCGGGGGNEDSLLLLQQVDSGPLTLKEVWLFNVSPIFFTHKRWRGIPGHPSLHNCKQQWFQLNVIFFIDCLHNELIHAYCTTANFKVIFAILEACKAR